MTTETEANPEFIDICDWLRTDLGYPQYVKAFEDLGFDQWSILHSLEVNHITDSHQIKTGHAVRIVKELESMQINKEQKERRIQLRKDTKLTQQAIDVSLHSMLIQLKDIIEKYQWKLKRNMQFDHELTIEHLEEAIDDICSQTNCMMEEMNRCKHDLRIQLKQISGTIAHKYRKEHSRRSGSVSNRSNHSNSKPFSNLNALDDVEDLSIVVLEDDDELGLDGDEGEEEEERDCDERGRREENESMISDHGDHHKRPSTPSLTQRQKTILTQSIIDMVHHHDDSKKKKKSSKSKRDEFQAKILKKMQERLKGIRNERVNGGMLEKLKRSQSHIATPKSYKVSKVEYSEEQFPRKRAQSANPLRRRSMDDRAMGLRKVTVFDEEIKPKSAKRSKRRKSRHRVR